MAVISKMFSAAWAALIVFMPSGTLLTIINYSLYFMSAAIISVPSFSVLSLLMKQIYAIIIAVII